MKIVTTYKRHNDLQKKLINYCPDTFLKATNLLNYSNETYLISKLMHNLKSTS